MSLLGKNRQYFINDPLKFMKDAIEWSAFPPLLKDLYHDDTEDGGRPNIQIITMVKILFLQPLYNLSDQQAEKEIHDRISFVNFIYYPDLLPDSKTIWFFRERLSKTGRDSIIWKELQRQPDSKGIKIRKGTAQDATFIPSDPGHKKHQETRELGKTRRSKGETFTKKNGKTYFGYKGHILTDLNPIPLIRSYAVTTASTHDSRIDLSKQGIPVYRVKGNFGTKPKGYDATMSKSIGSFKLSHRLL
ncbi:MAG: transposase [Thermoplasmatales archaeon]